MELLSIVIVSVIIESAIATFNTLHKSNGALSFKKIGAKWKITDTFALLSIFTPTGKLKMECFVKKATALMKEHSILMQTLR
jgi:hypothetical protein